MDILVSAEFARELQRVHELDLLEREDVFVELCHRLWPASTQLPDGCLDYWTFPVEKEATPLDDGEHVALVIPPEELHELEWMRQRLVTSRDSLPVLHEASLRDTKQLLEKYRLVSLGTAPTIEELEAVLDFYLASVRLKRPSDGIRSWEEE